MFFLHIKNTGIPQAHQTVRTSIYIKKKKIHTYNQVLQLLYIVSSIIQQEILGWDRSSEALIIQTLEREREREDTSIDGRRNRKSERAQNYLEEAERDRVTREARKCGFVK